jgi:hypothetical protein
MAREIGRDGKRETEWGRDRGEIGREREREKDRERRGRVIIGKQK